MHFYTNQLNIISRALQTKWHYCSYSTCKMFVIDGPFCFLFYIWVCITIKLQSPTQMHCGKQFPAKHKLDSCSKVLRFKFLIGKWLPSRFIYCSYRVVHLVPHIFHNINIFISSILVRLLVFINTENIKIFCGVILNPKR